MLKRHLLLASILAGTFAVTACSQQTEENTEAAIESAGDDAAANADAAAAEVDAAAAEAGRISPWLSGFMKTGSAKRAR